MPFVNGMWTANRIAKLKELWPLARSGKALAVEINKLPGPPVNHRTVMRMARTLALEITPFHAARGIGPRVVRVGSAAYRPQQSEVDCRRRNVSRNDAFCTAMQAAIDQGLEHASPGIFVIDDYDVRAARRAFILVAAPSSYVGSPAAACAES